MQPHPSNADLHDAEAVTTRLASSRPTDDQARAIIASPEAHRAFIATLCAGMIRAAGKRA